MRAALFGFALMAMLGCGPAPSVDLSQPPVPSRPTEPTKPTTNPGGGGTGGTTAQPSPTPIPRPPLRSRLRAVCSDSLTGALYTISSSARPTDGVPRLKIHFENATSDREVTASRNPVPVVSGNRDELNVIYEGAREISIGQAGPLRVLFAKVDLPMRVGVAKDLGSAVPLSSGVREAAERFGLQARNAGVSDRGSYLVVPRQGSFDILSRATLARLASVPLDPSKTVMPQIFETEGLMSALSYEGGAFKLKLARVVVNGGKVSVSAPSTLAPQAGSTFFSPSWLRPGALVWVEAETKSAFSPRSITFVKYDVNKGSTERSRFARATSDERLSPQLAVVQTSGGPLLVVAAEISSVRPSSPTGRERQLTEGRVVYLSAAQGSVKEVASLPYPSTIVKSSQSYGFDGAFAVRRVLAPTGAGEALISIDAGVGGEMLFKDRGGSLDGVGGLDCTDPNVIIEEVP